MAIRIDASGDDLRRSANLPDESAFTVCGWCNVTTDRGSLYQVLASLEAAGTSYAYFAWEGGTANTAEVGSNAQLVTLASRPAAGDWFFWALVGSSSGASGLTARWSAATSNTFVSATANNTSFTPNRLTIGNDSFSEWLNGRFAFVKCWDAALTEAELLNEKWTALPKRFANLNFFWPLRNASETQDWSTNNRNATVTGTLGTEDGPPVSWSGVPVGFRTFSPAAAGNDIAAAGSLSITGAADLDAIGQLAAAGSLTINGAADLDAVGNLLAAGALSITGSADLDATGSLAAAGSVVITGAADLTEPTANDISAAGALTITGAATINSVAELLAAGTIFITGSDADLTDGGAPPAPVVPFSTGGGGRIWYQGKRKRPTLLDLPNMHLDDILRRVEAEVLYRDVVAAAPAEQRQEAEEIIAPFSIEQETDWDALEQDARKVGALFRIWADLQIAKQKRRAADEWFMLMD